MREQRPAPHHNLFRRKDESDLYCAVSEGWPVPPFIRAPVWEFVGKHDAQGLSPLVFRERAAQVAMQHRGFYAFHLFGSGQQCSESSGFAEVLA